MKSGGSRPVNHDMAIGAHWSQILNRIDFILRANRGKGANMMDH